MKLTYLQDVLGQNYVGLIIEKSSIKKLLDDFKRIVYTKNAPDFKKARTEYQNLVDNQVKRDKGHYHLTFLSVAEFNQLQTRWNFDQSKVDELFNIDVTDLELPWIGSGTDKSSTTYFIVANSDILARTRKDLGFEPKDFHVTIGFNPKDVFNIRKNASAYVRADNLMSPLQVKLLDLKFINRWTDMKFNFMESISNWNQTYDNTHRYLQLDKDNPYNENKTVANFTYNQKLKLQIGLIDSNEEDLYGYDNLSLSLLTVSEIEPSIDAITENTDSEKIGTIHHYTSYESFFEIAKSNMLKAAYSGGDYELTEFQMHEMYTISVSKNDNLNQIQKLLPFSTAVRISLDGDKIAKSHKIFEFNDTTIPIDLSEFRIDRDINNIFDYITGVDFIEPVDTTAFLYNAKYHQKEGRYFDELNLEQVFEYRDFIVELGNYCLNRKEDELIAKTKEKIMDLVNESHTYVDSDICYSLTHKITKSEVDELKVKLNLNEATKYLGIDMCGLFFEIGDKILKLTTNRGEVGYATYILENKINSNHIARIQDVFQYDDTTYGIIYEKVNTNLSPNLSTMLLILGHEPSLNENIANVSDDEILNYFNKTMVGDSEEILSDFNRIREVHIACHENGLPTDDIYAHNIGINENGSLVYFDISSPSEYSKTFNVRQI